MVVVMNNLETWINEFMELNSRVSEMYDALKQIEPKHPMLALASYEDLGPLGCELVPSKEFNSRYQGLSMLGSMKKYAMELESALKP